MEFPLFVLIAVACGGNTERTVPVDVDTPTTTLEVEGFDATTITAVPEPSTQPTLEVDQTEPVTTTTTRPTEPVDSTDNGQEQETETPETLDDPTQEQGPDDATQGETTVPAVNEAPGEPEEVVYWRPGFADEWENNAL